ncbi:Pentatricopeptide repeat-containing protein At1g52620 [Linum grandiflorum]
MSKTLLSRIRPLNHPKPICPPSSPAPFTSNFRSLVYDVLHILRTDHQWQESLDSLFVSTETEVWEIAHFVFEKIREPVLGLKFFDWASEKSDFDRFPLNEFACSSLLKLLARSWVFEEVENLLETMKCKGLIPTREAFSVAIQAYAEAGLVDRALTLYNAAPGVYNLFPDTIACNSMLNALVKCNKLDIARGIYGDMVRREGVVDNYSVGIMVRGFCKEGKVDEAKKFIERRWGKRCVPNIVFYNMMIDGYCKNGDTKRAVKLFKELKLKGFLPNLETYGALINGHSKDGEFEEVDKLLVEIKARGLRVNVWLQNIITDARIKSNCKIKAPETIPDIVTYNSLICGSCRDGKLHEAEELLKEAVKRGLTPNCITYTSLIHAYSKQGKFVKASDLLIEMTKNAHMPDLIVYGALIHGLVCSGEVDVALTVREEMRIKGVVADANVYNVLLNGLCKKGRLPAAKILLAEMLDQNVAPDAFVNATLVDGFIRNGNLSEAKKIFELTSIKGIDPGVVGYNAMVKGFCKFGLMNDAMLFLRKMVSNDHVPDEFTYSTVIDGYIKQNDLHGALRMFGQMLKRRCKPNVVTYTCLINGFCRSGDSSTAETTFVEMQLSGLEPNVVTYSILIGCFSKVGKLRKACLYFDQMLFNKCVPNDVTFNYLINGFANNVEALKHEVPLDETPLCLQIFECMISDGWEPRDAAHSSVILCLCQYRMVETAITFCDRMRNKGLVPNPVSFIALLHGLCLDGRSREWMNIIPFHLSEEKLRTAIMYSQKLNQLLPRGFTAESLNILYSLLEAPVLHAEG